jgi:hypothetical protein
MMRFVRNAVFGVFAVVAMAAFGAGSANAQATRTWVSGVGDDANPCSRTAPCKTFAGAISKTAAGGEIDCLDPGGFGAVTITKGITIDCGGFTGGILNAGTNGVIINAGVNDKIFLRNLSINGAGSGLDGIRFLAGAQLSVHNCTIFGMTGDGIEVSKAATGEVYISSTYITNANRGIVLTNTTGFLTVFINDVIIANAATNGVEQTSNGIFTTIEDSSIVSAATNGVVISAGNGQINVARSEVNGSGNGVNAASNGSLIRISDNIFYNNGADVAIGAGATVASNTSNKTGPNSGAVPNGAITVR